MKSWGPVVITFSTIHLPEAQTFSTLHSFASADGANPLCGLTSSSNYLYGTAYAGGVFGNGTVFRVHTDGSGFATLHDFVRATDGAGSSGRLLVSGETLYGTTSGGGAAGGGTLFSMSTDGSSFTVLHSFSAGTGGNSPRAGLVLNGEVLYGTATGGGAFGDGTVFSLKVDGADFSTLHSFDTFRDGAQPVAALTLIGSLLYGTTFVGSDLNFGTVFAISTDGTQFNTLHDMVFANEGGWQASSLTFANEIVYGATRGGGAWGKGTIFTIDTTGANVRPLHAFNKEDGAEPMGALIVTTNSAFGTTSSGGTSSNGTVFVLDLAGGALRTLHHFSPTSGPSAANPDGALPSGDLLLLGTTLYGTTSAGGSAGQGTMFMISLAPELKFSQQGSNLILSWPNQVAGFDYTGLRLLSTTNMAAPVNWTVVDDAATTVVDGETFFTNSTTLTEQFYCLGP